MSNFSPSVTLFRPVRPMRAPQASNRLAPPLSQGPLFGLGFETPFIIYEPIRMVRTRAIEHAEERNRFIQERRAESEEQIRLAQAALKMAPSQAAIDILNRKAGQKFLDKLHLNLFMKNAIKIPAKILILVKAPLILVFGSQYVDQALDYVLKYLTDKTQDKPVISDLAKKGGELMAYIGTLLKTSTKPTETQKMPPVKQPVIRFSSASESAEATLWSHRLIEKAQQAYQYFFGSINAQDSEAKKFQNVVTLVRQNLQATKGNPLFDTQARAELDKLQTFYDAVNDAFSNLPPECANFNDLPVKNQDRINGVIFDALASQDPDLISWAEAFARELGVSDERMFIVKNRIMQIGRKYSS